MPKYYNHNSHTGIISADDFQKVQQLLREKNIPGRSARQSIFTRMLYCADCGIVFSRKENASHNLVWICRKHMQNVSFCQVRPVYEAELKSAFLAMCSKLQVNRKRVLEPIEKDLLHLRYILEQKDKESADIHEDIRCLTKKNHNLERIYNMGGIEAVQYWERRAVIERQIAEKSCWLNTSRTPEEFTDSSGVLPLLIEVTASCTHTSGICLFRSERYRTGGSDPSCLPACIPGMQHSRRW